MKLVCIPAFNEEKTIGDIIKHSMTYVDHVVVCDDGSTDNTAKVAEQSGAHIISHKKNQGYGASMTSLFDFARQEDADIMITLDGDGQHDPKQIPNLLQALSEKNADVVIGSRFLDDKSKTAGYRKHGIKIITSTANIGSDFKSSDSQSGFRAYSKKAIQEIHPTEKGMSVSTEILLKASNKNLTVVEVPISISYGKNTSTQNPVPHGVEVLMNTLKFISVKHPIPFYGFPGIAILAIGTYLGYQFLEAYLSNHVTLMGSFLAAIIMFLVGSILCVTSVMLFSMATLIRERR